MTWTPEREAQLRKLDGLDRHQAAELFEEVERLRADLGDLRAALAQVMPVDDADNAIPLVFIARLALPEADRDALTRMGHGAIETAAKVLHHELAAMPEDRRNFISSKLTIGDETYSLTYQREGGKTPADIIVERDAARDEAERLGRIVAERTRTIISVAHALGVCECADGHDCSPADDET